jgi:hypothetical protein
MNTTRRFWLTRAVPAVAALAVLTVLAGDLRHRHAQADAARSYRLIRWWELTPKEWDPTKRLRELDLNAMKDSDPRSQRFLQDMRATWDNAPTVSALNGEAVRLVGYIVPLDGPAAELREFLLVPYFGACIHTPPPPANQIVHVIADQAFKGLHAMDTVKVSGVLKAARYASADMGVSGYEIKSAAVERFVPAQPK